MKTHLQDAFHNRHKFLIIGFRQKSDERTKTFEAN